MTDRPCPQQPWETDAAYQARLTMWDRSVAADKGVRTSHTLTKEETHVEVQLAWAETETQDKETIKMSVSTTTDIVEVIPVLTAENFEEALARFEARPIPDHYRDKLKADNSKLGLADANEDVTTIDGKPTQWFVSLDDNEMWLKTKLPCSVKYCDGHSFLEADKWDELYHEVLNSSLPDMTAGEVEDSDSSILLLLRDSGPVVNYRIVYEGELKVAELDELITTLRETLISLQVFQQQANELVGN